MKFLIFILVLAISVQPLQAGSCDMDTEKNQGTSHHMDKSEQGSHDCCDSDDSNEQEGCDGGMDCGFCFVSVSALSSLTRVSPSWGSHYSPHFSSGVDLPSHSSPPFRPPIS